MTAADAPVPTTAPAAPWTLRRTTRTSTAEAWDLVDEKHERAGTLTVLYAPGAVEGVLGLPTAAGQDATRGILAWLTDLLTLDAVAGPGGMIHWTVVTGPLEDFWRRSPGHRASGVETDVATARARVEPVLRSMFPALETTEDGRYAVDAGSVRVFVDVRVVDGVVMVRVYAITNLDVPVDGELPAYLLRLNFGLVLGRFSLDADHGAVWFDHLLTADQLDDTTLSRTVAAVASTADRYDDDIKARFGGRTFHEAGDTTELPHPGMAGGYL